jgi:hypothetical protein
MSIAFVALRFHRSFLRTLTTSVPLHSTGRSNVPVGRVTDSDGQKSRTRSHLVARSIPHNRPAQRPSQPRTAPAPPAQRSGLPSFLSRGVVALVGRPNVGKSTLFNRLVGRRLALVDATPGTTRDRKSGQGSIADLHFDVFDTPGLDDADSDASVNACELQASMTAQTKSAVASADVILFMVHYL